jgi:hypothetical protein
MAMTALSLTVPQHNANDSAGIAVLLFVVCMLAFTMARSILVMRSKPQAQWRFSLRTLLIATTLVAVGLGIVAALS